MSDQTSRFSSRLATLLTMAGVAIGLGNVWRFPYMMGQNGGSAFLLIYVVFMLLLAIPALSSEWTLGRATRSGPVGAFQAAFGSKFGLVIGLVLGFSVFIVSIYYTIVVGNVMYSAWFATLHGFTEETMPAYQAALGRNGLQYAVALGMLLASLWVVQRGLQKGIETVNKIFVPMFGLAALYMVFVSLNLDGATEKLAEFLKPDFSNVGPSVWFAAMGQACFSVGLSGTLCVMYGSYLRDQAQLGPNSGITCLMDLGAAFMGALFVVPAVLVFGLDLAAGPPLLFNTLPQLFAAMPGGRFLAPIFLLGWALVSMLTIIAAFDTVITSFAELGGQRFHKRNWLWIGGTAAALVMLPIALNPQWIGVLDMIFGNGMFMLGALLAVLAAGWGLGKTVLREQVSGGMSPRLADWMTWWIRWVVPIALAAILLGYIYSTLTSGAH